MKFSEVILKSASTYSENIPLRLILTTVIPVIGPSIDLALSSYANQIYEKRVLRCIEILKKEVNVLSQKSINKEFLQSESFFDIFRLFLEKSIRTRQDEKIQYYARLLTDGIKNPETVEQTEQDIDKISALSVRDIMLMNHIYENHLQDPEHFGNPDDFVKGTLSMKQIPNNLPEIDGLSKSEIGISINNLIAVGLIREFVGSAGTYKGGWYFVTPLLEEIMKKLFREKLSEV